MAGDEDALLNGAAAERRAESRLSCQIKMDAGLDSRRDRLIGALECDFIPRDVWANAQARGSDELDHERDISLAIHAAIPDLIRDTNRHVIRAGSGCLMA
jgi:hypothetical protein